MEDIFFMEEKEYSVSEAVQLTGVPSHVMRYWEEELQIEIKRTSQGYRIYSEKNLETFRQVKALKEKGIQLRAIRVLLDEHGKKDEELAEQVQEITGYGRQEAETESQVEERPADTCQLVLQEEQRDNLRQFEEILKRMMEEVVAEQNEKLESAIGQMIREEIEALYLQYCQASVAEAAAAGEKRGLRKLVEKVKRKGNGKRK